MSDIDLDDIRRFDGGLLLVFRELCRRRRTTAVAAHLGLSQSAVSHSLARLRDLFGDVLFFRRPHGLEPTRRALELAPRVEALIELMGEAIQPNPGFDPARSERVFRLAATEFAHDVIDGALVDRLRRLARRSAFTLQFLRGYIALDVLRRGQLDLVLGRFDTTPAGIVGEPLQEDRYCVVARRGHPTIRGTITEEQWKSTGHVFVGSISPSDEVMGPAIGEDAIPSAAEVATTAIVPRWEMALSMVSDSDAIATGPRRLAERLADRLALQVLTPPTWEEGEPCWRVSMIRRDETDFGLDWLRAQLREIAAA